MSRPAVTVRTGASSARRRPAPERAQSASGPARTVRRPSNRSRVESRRPRRVIHTCGARAPGRPSRTARFGSAPSSGPLRGQRGRAVHRGQVIGQALRRVDLRPPSSAGGTMRHRTPLGLIGVQQRLVRPAADDPGELPGQVVGVGDGHAGAGASGRGRPVGGVADQEDPTGREGGCRGGTEVPCEDPLHRDVGVGHSGGQTESLPPLRRGPGGRRRAVDVAQGEIEHPAARPGRKEQGVARRIADGVAEGEAAGHPTGQVEVHQRCDLRDLGTRRRPSRCRGAHESGSPLRRLPPGMARRRDPCDRCPGRGAWRSPGFRRRRRRPVRYGSGPRRPRSTRCSSSTASS